MDKTVIITGSSSGIGKSAVELFAKNNWQVIATSRKIDSSYSEGNIYYYKLDVSSPEEIAIFFKTIKKDFKKVDVVVNNAGYSLKGIFESMTNNQIQKQFQTNVFGLMQITRESIKLMRPNKSGKIIQVSSMGGRLAFPLYSVYHSTKWAVDGFSESLSYELDEIGIKIKIIEPGVINTNFYSKSQINVESDNLTEYNGFINKINSKLNQSAESGNKPEVVAKTIFTAANDGSNKLRYVVGSPAPLLFLIKKLTSDRFFRKLIKFNYSI